eukprot:12998163-Heterocapsa_arctica.AAC.1
MEKGYAFVYETWEDVLRESSSSSSLRVIGSTDPWVRGQCGEEAPPGGGRMVHLPAPVEGRPS